MPTYTGDMIRKIPHRKRTDTEENSANYVVSLTQNIKKNMSPVIKNPKNRNASKNSRCLRYSGKPFACRKKLYLG